MTYSNQELVNRFLDGADSGTACNMEITEPAGGGTAVVGYEHAVYAYRPPDDRYKPVVFTGWSDASSSTNQHISLLTGNDVIELGGRAKKDDVDGDPDITYLFGISDGDKSYGGYHRARNRRGV